AAAEDEKRRRRTDHLEDDPRRPAAGHAERVPALLGEAVLLLEATSVSERLPGVLHHQRLEGPPADAEGGVPRVGDDHLGAEAARGRSLPGDQGGPDAGPPR